MAVSESEHQQCRRQGKRRPCGERAEQSATEKSNREANLAAGRTGQELAKPYNVGVGGLIKPFAANDELVAEISQVGNRPAERSAAQPQKAEKDRRPG
jgi:hypothetical protein